jgi:hypothetical protein
MTNYISPGVTTTLTQNIVYALPGALCKLYSQTAGATFTQSNDIAFAASTACTLVEGAYEVSAAFIKSTAGDAVVLLKRV